MNTMNTGDVCRRIGLVVTTELLLELGFEPVGKDKRATLWDQADYRPMCVAIGKHIADKQTVPMQPKPAGKPKASAPAAAKSKPTKPPVDDDDDL